MVVRNDAPQERNCMAKIKKTYYLSEDALKKVGECVARRHFESPSDFIEKAIEYYSGFLGADESREFFSHAFLSTFKGVMESFEDRFSRLMFKNAVELSMLMHVVAASTSIGKEDLTRLRGMCVKDVKNTKGKITFEEAVKFQRGG